MPPPTPRILRRLVGFTRYARTTVGAISASVFLVGDDERAPSLVGVMSDWDWTGTSFATTVSSWTTAEEALATGRVLILSREAAVGLEAEWFGPRSVVRVACVPLCAGNQRFGAMFFDFDQDDRAVDTVYLAEVGRRCARALARPPARNYAARWRNNARPGLRARPKPAPR